MMQKRIVLAAGGTGGHIFPAEALAAQLLAEGHSPILVTDTRHGNYPGTLGGLPTHKVLSASPSGGILKLIKAGVFLELGTWQALFLLRKLRPQVVVGFGGYPSFPTIMAAALLGIRTVIHEQNAVLGRVNRLLAPFVKVIATSFQDVSYVRPKDRKKIIYVGNPVRPAILEAGKKAYVPPKKTGMFRLLVTGGSQGAAILSEVVPAAVALLPEKLKKRLHIVQQCRQENLEEVQETYRRLKIKAEVSTFFTDMPKQLQKAHLVIARSGASTVAELMVMGQPAILIPYAHATDDHQTANAHVLEAAGGAILMPQREVTAAALSQQLEKCMVEPQRLRSMAKALQGLRAPSAAESLARVVGE